MKRFGMMCLGVFAPIVGLGACAGTATPDKPANSLTLAVAPLTLTSLGKVCYDVRVTNAPDGGGETVWERGTPGLNNGTPDATALCSTQFGNAGGGDISYVGPCDADGQEDPGDVGGERTNSVTVWFDGLYDDVGTYLDPSDDSGWVNPCADANGVEVGCTLNVLCEENADAAVNFNFTVMRGAKQGFFDIAVNFQNIFCSAKLDTCYNVGTLDETPIELLFGADEARDWTAVFGFACTAGDGDADTTLLYNNITVTCDDGGDVTTFPIDPTVPEGNASVDVGGNVLHYGVYRGLEALNCATGSCNKAYWNLAFSLDDLENFGGDCELHLSATATDGNSGFENGLPTAEGGSYPYIEVTTNLTTGGAAECQENPLDGGVVTTTYHGPTEPLTDAETMCYQLDASGVGPVEGAVCNEVVPAIEVVLAFQGSGVGTAGVTFTLNFGGPSDDVAVTDDSGRATFTGPYPTGTFTVTGGATNCGGVGATLYSYEGGEFGGWAYDFDYMGVDPTVVHVEYHCAGR